jgi:hypothetical protein
MRARLEDEAHKIMPNQWWKNMMPWGTINTIISLDGKSLMNHVKIANIAQHDTRSKETRKTRRVLLKNIFFTVSSNRQQRLFKVNIEGSVWIAIPRGGIYIPENITSYS